ncbi:MAG: efflux RND transporter periplasmic adaptor subunit [Syntrophales bacterium]|nr:efflux RND transporter periplasmic adaptor subunit [Syntrophales bacterium]
MKKRIAVSLLLMLFIPAGCSNTDNQPKKDVKLTPHIYKASILKVQGFIEATGTIQADLEGGAKIVAPVPGVVDKIFVKFGESVKAGAQLLSIRSTDVNDTYMSYQSSLSQLKQTERLYGLNKKLFEVGAVTKNDLLASEAGYEQAKAATQGLKNKLEIYGALSSKGFQDKLIIKAPISGYVADLQAHIGDRFDASSAMMIIANPNKVIVVANIYDTDIPKIHKGQEVSFYTDVFPDTLFKGSITYINDVEDMDSKTVKTYIAIADHKNYFKQNMFLKIKIFDKERFLSVIPKTALIYKNGFFYVNVKNKEQIELKEVKPIRDTSEKLMAVDGLKEGEEIVYSAIELEKP